MLHVSNMSRMVVGSPLTVHDFDPGSPVTQAFMRPRHGLPNSFEEQLLSVDVQCDAYS